MSRRKSTLRVPQLCLHKASGRGYVTLNGSEHYLGKFGTPECDTAYRSKLMDWMAHRSHIASRTQQFNSNLVQQSPVTINELLAQYLIYASVHYVYTEGLPTRTIEQVKRAVTLVRSHFDRVFVSDFGPLKLIALQEKLIADNYSRKYINALIDDVRQIFRWGVSRELVPPAIWEGLKSVAGIRKGRARETIGVKPVSDQLVKQTLPYLPQIIADMVKVQRITACRPQDVCNLRPCDVDTSQKIWLYRPPHHKTAHLELDRTIFLPAEAQAILQQYLENRHPDEYCFQPIESKKMQLIKRRSTRKTNNSCGNVPGSNRVKKPRRKANNKYDTHAYARAIRRACVKAFPIPPQLNATERETWRKEHYWTLNQLRHTGLTLVRKDYGIEEAQVIGGHARADVTQIYAQRDITKGIEVAAKLSRVFD
jgi:integrase